jgi:hypothetical protein
MTTQPLRAELHSTTLRTAEYDPQSAQLLLDFRDGSRYCYATVGMLTFLNLLQAPSPASFFNREIRNRYAHVRIS